MEIKSTITGFTIAFAAMSLIASFVHSDDKDLGMSIFYALGAFCWIAVALFASNFRRD